MLQCAILMNVHYKLQQKKDNTTAILTFKTRLFTKNSTVVSVYQSSSVFVKIICQSNRIVKFLVKNIQCINIIQCYPGKNVSNWIRVKCLKVFFFRSVMPQPRVQSVFSHSNETSLGHKKNKKNIQNKKGLQVNDLLKICLKTSSDP